MLCGYLGPIDLLNLRMSCYATSVLLAKTNARVWYYILWRTGHSRRESPPQSESVKYFQKVTRLAKPGYKICHVCFGPLKQDFPRDYKTLSNEKKASKMEALCPMCIRTLFIGELLAFSMVAVLRSRADVLPFQELEELRIHVPDETCLTSLIWTVVHPLGVSGDYIRRVDAEELIFKKFNRSLASMSCDTTRLTAQASEFLLKFVKQICQLQNCLKLIQEIWAEEPFNNYHVVMTPNALRAAVEFHFSESFTLPWNIKPKRPSNATHYLIFDALFRRYIEKADAPDGDCLKDIVKADLKKMFGIGMPCIGLVHDNSGKMRKPYVGLELECEWVKQSQMTQVARNHPLSLMPGTPYGYCGLCITEAGGCFPLPVLSKEAAFNNPRAYDFLSLGVHTLRFHPKKYSGEWGWTQIVDQKVFVREY